MLDSRIYMKTQNNKELEELQKKLFAMGYSWPSLSKQVRTKDFDNRVSVVVVYPESMQINWRWGPEGVDRFHTLVTHVAHEFQEEEETVKLNGNTYYKKDLEAALDKLTPVED